MMRLRLLLPLLLVGCNRQGDPRPVPAPIDAPGEPAGSLVEARKGFVTKHTGERLGEPAVNPPANVFRLVKYDAPPGKMSAYLTPDPGDGKKRPAIVWVTGGDCNTIDAGVWKPAAAQNDQSAKQYREAGIVMMFPSLRGGNDNPGFKEGYLGEVDDVLAAAEYLAKQPHVDADRIYLGGHSTGGTLVMLVAASSDRFRAVFSFGPADSPSRYPPEYTPFDTTNPREVELRSPGKWLHSIRSPTFVFEGATNGNLSALTRMQNASKNPKARFFAVNNADHFSLLAPVNRLIASKILKDTGPQTNIAFTEEEVNGVMMR